MKEIIICSAIKTSAGTIIRGHRHNDCLERMQRMKLSPINSEQGFITSRNRFVTRTNAWVIQTESGIKSKDPRGYSDSGVLFSEDLY